jgi:hypothetical protein
MDDTHFKQTHSGKTRSAIKPKPGNYSNTGLSKRIRGDMHSSRLNLVPPERSTDSPEGEQP